MHVCCSAIVLGGVVRQVIAISYYETGLHLKSGLMFVLPVYATSSTDRQRGLTRVGVSIKMTKC